MDAITMCKDEMMRRASFAPEKVSVWKMLGVFSLVCAAIALLFIGCALIGF